MNKSIKTFNLRVYALIIDKGEILLSKELIKGNIAIKFPGGGVELGEGIIEALQRESEEELNQRLINIKHFYTTDFFQQSSFKPKDQLISIYYKASLTTKIKTSECLTPIKDQPIFYWKKIKDIDESELRFRIDKLVLQLLKKQL